MDLLKHLVELRDLGEPVALATVVASRRPASARPGDRALVLANGDLLGWVGGSCAQPAVQREGLRALADGRPRLVRLSPEAGLVPSEEGIVDEVMTCHSGGTLEIYVEPFRPAPRLLITGDSPIAEALAELAALDDFRVSREVPTDATASDTAERYVVLAGMSGEDQIDLERALALDPSYLAFVGSRKRLAEITSRLQERGVSAEQLARVKGPAGLDIGAQTAFEIAISIMAEIVQHRRRPSPPNPLSRSAGEGGRGRGLESAPDAPRVDIAVDPVCGMEVAVAGARHVLEHAGQQFYFCCPACRRLFAADPEQFLTRPATHDQDRSINAFSG